MTRRSLLRGLAATTLAVTTGVRLSVEAVLGTPTRPHHLMSRSELNHLYWQLMHDNVTPHHLHNGRPVFAIPTYVGEEHPGFTSA